MNSLDSIQTVLASRLRTPIPKKRNNKWRGWMGHKRGTHVHPVCFVANNSDPHFLMVPCWKITLFVIVPVLGPLVALIICYNWLHRRLAGTVLGQQSGPLSWRDQAALNGKLKEGGWEQGSRFRAGMSFLLCPHGQPQTPQRIQKANHLLRPEGVS